MAHLSEAITNTTEVSTGFFPHFYKNPNKKKQQTGWPLVLKSPGMQFSPGKKS